MFEDNENKATIVAQSKELSGSPLLSESLNALADLGGHAGCTPPPMGPNSFGFTYIFTKKHPRQRSMPPLTGARPPTGNPGSATA